jgi:type IV secretory pathway protease TraF
VYSASKISCFIWLHRKGITDRFYTTPGVVWGIDGDWMVNMYPAHTAFHPTDHCGYIRVLNPLLKKIPCFCSRR